VALVAASSRGLGRTIADGLADEGARVMISARDEAALAQTAREIREATGAEVDHHVTDLTQADDIRVLVKRTAERFGGVDVLVSNAGGPPAGFFDTVSDEDWRGAFELKKGAGRRVGVEDRPHATLGNEDPAPSGKETHPRSRLPLSDEKAIRIG